MGKDVVERNVGRCLTERKLKNFEEQAAKHAEFVNISQFEHPQPGFIHQVNRGFQDTTDLKIGYILYGVSTEDGTLTWLGEIIDSSD